MTDLPTTLGALRSSGFPDRTVKRELRDNLLAEARIGRGPVPRPRRFRRLGAAGARARHPRRARSDPARRARTGEDAAGARPGGLARRAHAGDRGHRDERPPVPADQRARTRARGGARRRDAARVDRARGTLRREARDPRHERRRSDRRRRPDQGGRGPLPRRRRHDPLRPDPAHEPWHRRDQRAARPARAHPGERCSTSSRSATCRSAGTGSVCRSTCCSSQRRTPTTTRTAGASSRR